MVMTDSDPIAQERAIQLAIVYLTRRDDLHVVRSQDECQPHLMVSLLEEGLPTGKYLGVVAKAIPYDDSQAIERTLRQANFDTFREAPFPICLFVFAMETDNGYWKWLRKPIETPPGLMFAYEAEWTPLNNTTLNNLLVSVKQWYEERGKQGIQK
jgi:hypothetical protein